MNTQPTVSSVSSPAAAAAAPAPRHAVLRPALVVLALLSALTGIVYPLVVTGLAQAAFPDQAGGSLIVQDGQVVGSRLIGQTHSDARYFWGRPSGLAPAQPGLPAQNGAAAVPPASGAANLGPSNPALQQAVQARIQALRAADPGQRAPVPIDLVTTSGSGLDPHLSVAGVLYQAGRVARARHLPLQQVQQLVAQHTEGRLLGLLGEPRVNVLALNLALDARAQASTAAAPAR